MYARAFWLAGLIKTDSDGLLPCSPKNYSELTKGNYGVSVCEMLFSHGTVVFKIEREAVKNYKAQHVRKAIIHAENHCANCHANAAALSCPPLCAGRPDA